MATNMSKIDRKRKNALASCSVAFMNNTKWREVLEIVSAHEMPIQLAQIYAKQFGLARVVPKNGLAKTHTKDWGGGPAEYKTIFAIRWGRFEAIRDPATGRISADECKSIALVAELSKLGQLPLEIESEFVVIHGYRSPP